VKAQIGPALISNLHTGTTEDGTSMLVTSKLLADAP
jgi:hypothetical protein